MRGVIRQNITFSLRTLFKHPGFTLTAVLTLALGIGATTAIFSVVYAVFEPMPYPKPDQLVMVWSRIHGERNSVAPGDYLEWKRRSTSFSDMNAWGGGSFNVATRERPEQIERFLSCDARLSALEEPHLPLRRRSLRVVVSDFLFPHDADVLVGRLARDGASLALIQLTLPEEADPSVEGGRRMQDVEGHGEFDLVIDERAVRDYRERFGRLRLGLARAARRAGASFYHVLAGTPLRQTAKALAAAGILESL